jgi:hypothetical protein
MIQRRDFLLGAASTELAQAQTEFVSDDDVRTILKDSIDNARQSVGLVGCLFVADRQKIVTYDRSDGPNDRSPYSDTVFQIGSIYNYLHVFSEIVDLEDPTLDPTRFPLPPKRGSMM